MVVDLTRRHGPPTPLASQTPLTAPYGPTAIAITIVHGSPEGLVTSVRKGYGTVTPIDLGQGEPATPIYISGGAWNIVVAPDGATAYVISSPPGAPHGTITPIDFDSGKTGPLIDAGPSPLGVFLGGDGHGVHPRK